MTKILIFLPCNSGAYTGDYWSKPNWQSVGNRLEDKRKFLDYAAVDCIRAFHIDGKGLVHEKENTIVKGYDEHPSWNKFDPKTHGTEKLDKLKDAIKLSLEETKRYSHIFALLSPRAYKLGFAVATKEQGLDDKVSILDIGESPAYYNKGVLDLEIIVRDYLNKNEILNGVFMPPGHEEYFKTKHGGYRHDKGFPNEYRVWKKS
ncbi:hypothetical protein FJZ53_01230 [Candidatus Woesearchaeota archaeon]|nr:hypothetical protein [Candidatus Woesearchaeota archaeon]